MLHQSISFSVTLLEQSFELPDGRVLAQTAQVAYLDGHNKVFQTVDFGVVDKQELYQRIREGQSLSLHHCYVAEFSLAEYRELEGLANVDEIELPDFSAVQCFFDNHSILDLSYAHLSGASGKFTGSVFRSEVSFLKTRFTCSEVDFSQARFHGNANFRYAELTGGDVRFAAAILEGDSVSFVNSNLNNGRTDFSNARFHTTEANFQYARFREGDLTFDRSVFECRRVVMSKCEFGTGKKDFRLVSFGDADIDFSESEFKSGKVRFRRSTFGSGRLLFEATDFGDSEVSFERSEFGNGKLSFHRATGGLLKLNDCHFSGLVDLRVTQFNGIDLSNATNRDLMDLKTDQGEVAIRELNLSGLRNLGRISIDWTDNNVAALIHGQANSTDKQKADQFRLLKEEFHQAGQYNDEDAAYVQFKRLEWKHETAHLLGKKGAFRPYIYLQQFFKKLVFDWIGHYATNPIRVLGSMVIAFVAFSVLFLAVEFTGMGSIDSSLGDPDGLHRIEEAFYHSAITFLTIGYGDYYPSGLARPLSGLEGFVGLFLLSYFTVAFVRKILR